MDPLVSIIVPIYNSSMYLDKCLESIIDQVYTSLEIFLIDDGSTDNSVEICTQYKSADSRIRIICNSHRGVSFSRNQGINLATGKYIAFIDSDDFVDSRYILNLVHTIEIENSDLSICGYVDVYSNKNIKHMLPKNLTGIFRDDYYKIFFNGVFLLGPLGKIYKTDIIKGKEIKFDENLSYCEDTIFNLIYYRYVKSYSVVNECMYYYCHRSNHSLSQKYNVETLNSIKKMLVILNTFLKSLKIENGNLIYVDQCLSILIISGYMDRGQGGYQLFKKEAKNVRVLLNGRYDSVLLKRKFVLACIRYNQFWIIYLYYHYYKKIIRLFLDKIR